MQSCSCYIAKGFLYHHFPDGKESLLIACLQSADGAITADIESIFGQHPSMIEAIHAMDRETDHQRIHLAALPVGGA
ncbi:MAG: hypothetical protein ACI35R_14325 [Bacillus sp. (in: firmicutes)]